MCSTVMYSLHTVYWPRQWMCRLDITFSIIMIQDWHREVQVFDRTLCTGHWLIYTQYKGFCKVSILSLLLQTIQVGNWEHTSCLKDTKLCCLLNQDHMLSIYLKMINIWCSIHYNSQKSIIQQKMSHLLQIHQLSEIPSQIQNMYKAQMKDFTSHSISRY